jgi:DNA polymerase III delta prime subunit
MEQLNINRLLNRETEAASIVGILKSFEANKNNFLFKKGIYISGDPGTGKTTFIVNILQEMGYDVIKYDAGDIRNKSVIDDITKHTMSDRNIMSMLNNKVKKIVIIMDEIDGMNNGDKGGINTLIKLIRPKKTKKQKLEEITLNPIICIGNYRVDKKIKELMKVCNTIELAAPTDAQIRNILGLLMPELSLIVQTKLLKFVQGDLRKINNIYNIYKTSPEIFNTESFTDIFQMKSYNDDTKRITNKLINNCYNISDHINIMNETDRTSVGLLWHENIIDVIDKMDKKVSIPFYINQLDNICFADYIDRITFQKQIWQFNEMSSLIKTMKNNKMYHEQFKKKKAYNPTEVRFTKVLTKYSTEYNNSLFIQSLCQQLGMDKKDLFGYFVELRETKDDAQILSLFENMEITKLDINRIYRYLEKYTKENAPDTEDKEIDIEIEAEYEETM